MEKNGTTKLSNMAPRTYKLKPGEVAPSVFKGPQNFFQKTDGTVFGGKIHGTWAEAQKSLELVTADGSLKHVNTIWVEVPEKAI